MCAETGGVPKGRGCNPRCGKLLFLLALLAGLQAAQAQPGSPEAGSACTIQGIAFVYVPPGTFTMGSPPEERHRDPDEGPCHEVTLTQGFWIGRYEVTKAQWTAVMRTEPWAERPDYVRDHPDSPAVWVSWQDASEFADRLTGRGDGTFRLPTEAEWEYACRAGTATRFFYGDDPDYARLGDHAWYDRNANDIEERYAHVVGLKKANPWGLYDMAGNVWEWCQDARGHYSRESATDPVTPQDSEGGLACVIRGGSWHNPARYCRSAERRWYYPWNAFTNIGFRVVFVPDEERSARQ